MTSPGLLRPGLHAATGVLALTLGLLPPPWAVVAASLGLLAGWVVIPLTGLEARLRRPGERFLGGLRTYPLAVFALVALLDPTDAAAAWGVLAFGDAAAAFVGQRWPARALLGHPKATWTGSSAHVVVGACAAFALSQGAGFLAVTSGWVTCGVPPSLLACAAAALAAAIVDLVPLPPDDNLPAAAAAGGVLYAFRVMM